MNIKIGDMIKSNSGACGIVISLPAESQPEYIIINWNKKDIGETKTDIQNLQLMIKYGKWEIV